MTEEARQARNKYQREWRAKNKDKVKEYNQKKWERLAEKEAAKKGDDENRTD